MDRLITNEQVNGVVELLDGIQDAFTNKTFLQTKTATRSNVSITVTSDTEYVGLKEVVVEPCSLQSKTVTPSDSQIIVTPSSNYDGLSKVIVSPANLGTKTITEKGTYTASDDSLLGYSSVTVDIDAGDKLSLPSSKENIYLDNSTVVSSSSYHSYVVDLQDLEVDEFYIYKTLSDTCKTAFANSIDSGTTVYDYTDTQWTSKGVYCVSYTGQQKNYRYFIVFTDMTTEMDDFKALNLYTAEPVVVFDDEFDYELGVEKRIGYWINGKYLYQMTLRLALSDIPNTSLTNTNKYNHGIANIDMPVSAFAMSDLTTNTAHLQKEVKAMDGLTGNTSQYHIYLMRFSKTQIWLTRGSNSSEQNVVYVIVRYTKTTD